MRLGEALRRYYGIIVLCCEVHRCKSYVLYPRSVTVRSFHGVTFTLSVVPTNTSSEIVNVTTARSRHVRFVAPLLEYGYLPAIEDYESRALSNKPLLLYLPGFDGTFISPFLQLPELSTIFDVRCMTIATGDRSTLEELQNDVVQYLEKECLIFSSISASKNVTSFNLPSKKAVSEKSNPDVVSRRKSQQRRRPIYIAGESFGGILALIVSTLLVQEESNNFCLKGLALINSATCYERSKLAIEGPKVAQFNDWMYPFGLASRILPLFSDKYSMEQMFLILSAKALPSIIDNSCREAFMGRVAFSLPRVLMFMPKETLRWRLSSWLEAGCEWLASADKPMEKLQNLRTLIVAAENDAALPSIAEAERLTSLLKNSAAHVVEGAGHASTCGSRVDLAALFRFNFEELRPTTSKQRSNAFVFWQQPRNVSADESVGRLAMKETAAMGKGAYFGMQPRYDNAKIGLNPFRYWSPEYYKKFNPRDYN
jgi:hypothetical protein